MNRRSFIKTAAGLGLAFVFGPVILKAQDKSADYKERRLYKKGSYVDVLLDPTKYPPVHPNCRCIGKVI